MSYVRLILIIIIISDILHDNAEGNIKTLEAKVSRLKHLNITLFVNNNEDGFKCNIIVNEFCANKEIPQQILNKSLEVDMDKIEYYSRDIVKGMCLYQVSATLLKGEIKNDTAHKVVPYPKIGNAYYWKNVNGNIDIELEKIKNVHHKFNYTVYIASEKPQKEQCKIMSLYNYYANVGNSCIVNATNFNVSIKNDFMFTNYTRPSEYPEYTICAYLCISSKRRFNTCTNIIVQAKYETSFYIYLLVLPVAIFILGILFYIIYTRNHDKNEFLEEYYMEYPPKQTEVEKDIPKTLTTTFTKSSLDDFLREERSTVLIEEEHEKIPQHLEEFEAGQDKKKNRYKDVLPFASNVVKLNTLKGAYINASYIKNYKNENSYIATQGPLNDSQSDFWRMIWEQNVTTIVMLTNLIENQNKKCTKYWPDKRTTISYGKIKVYVVKVQEYVNYIVRDFNVSYKDDVKNVRQFHYTTWPDHSLPISLPNFVSFVRMVRDVQTSPVVVHCSAGIGRTGSFILINLVYQMAIETGNFDFAKTLQNMRSCRAYMLRESKQYKLCYCVVNELLNGEKMEITVESLFNKTLNETYLFKSTLEYINDNDYWLDIFKRSVHPFFHENTKKNRIQEPYKSCFGHFYLNRIADVDNSDYINAIKIGEKEFCTQQPMPCTIGDFWRLVTQKNIDLIVSLNAIDPDDKTSIVFWPMSIIAPMCPVDSLEIHFSSIKTDDGFDLVELKLTNIYEMTSRNIFLINFKTWRKNQLPQTTDFLKFYQCFLDIKKKNNIIFTCNDGATSVGVFLTFHYIAKQLEFDTRIDISSVIRQLRFYRDDFVHDLEQLRFIYIMVQKLILENESYRDKINEQLGTYSNISGSKIYENV